MYLIYIDDYGNTGDRLDDPNQPLFALYASLVPVEGGAWIHLEREIIEVMREVHREAQRLSLPAPERLHMVDLYQRTGRLYRQLTIEQTFHWIERVLKAMTDSGVKHRHIVMDKPMLMYGQQVRHEAGGYVSELERISCQAKGPNRFTVPLYDYVLPRLLWQIDDALEKLGEYGMVFLDQQPEYHAIEKLNVYRILRHRGMLKRLLETPIYRDGRFNTLLAVPDIAGFIEMGLEVDRLNVPPKQRPKLEEWHDTYLLMAGLEAEQPSWFNATNETEFMSGAFDAMRVDNRFEALDAIEWMQFKMLKAVPKTYKPPSGDGGLS